MRLADFIRAHREPILTEWEAFARTCAPAGGPMDVAGLRDHADQMLTVIAADLASPQTGIAESEKSKGRAPTGGPGTRDPAARTASEGALDVTDVEDLTRFNEAINQALAESVLRFNQDVEAAKETFLAILGHDLRTPLGAIQTSATFMLETGELEEPHRTLTARIGGSAKRSVTMVGDSCAPRSTSAGSCATSSTRSPPPTRRARSAWRAPAPRRAAGTRRASPRRWAT